MTSTWLEGLRASILPAALLALPLVLLGFPGSGELRASPQGEAVRHLWALERARATGSLSGWTDLVDYPDGATWSVIDPGNLPAYALGHALGGPAVGWNLLLWVGLALGGAGGWYLARQVGADRWGQGLGLAIGASSPGLLQAAADGMTEVLGIGLVALQLGGLIGLARSQRARYLVPVVVGIAGAAWMGPYNAVWVALIDIPIGLYLLSQRRWLHLVAGGLGALLAAPVLLLSLAQDSGAPGGSARGTITALDGSGWRGATRAGADLLDLVVPEPLLQQVAVLPATAYLGLLLPILALVGLWRWRSGWPWLLAAISFSALALGVMVTVRGVPTGWAGPAAWLELVPPLDRLSRWYRAGALVPFLCIPLAVRARPGPASALLALLVVLDARLLAPLPLRWASVEMPGAAFEQLRRPVVPFPSDQSEPSAGRLADGPLLAQLVHGQPVLYQLNEGEFDHQLAHALWLAEVPETTPVGLRMLQERGFTTLEVHTDHASEAQLRALEELFPAPSFEQGPVRIYDLEAL